MGTIVSVDQAPDQWIVTHKPIPTIPIIRNKAAITSHRNGRRKRLARVLWENSMTMAGILTE